MNTIHFSEKEKISADRKLAVLIKDAMHNSFESQQLALDASRLLASACSRLEEIKNQGFFKRCWSKISGKQGELSRANQADLIQMQKFAWYYINRLQEQNLIQAQAIAVIRNNLNNIALAETEIRQAVVTLVEKFDSRINKVEERIAALEWKATLNMERYDKYPEMHRVLKMVFDFYAYLRQHNTQFEDSVILESAFTDMGIISQKEITVSEFSEKLLCEIYNQGPELFLETVKIDVVGTLLGADYIMDNISGNAFNAIFQIYIKYPEALKIIKNIQDNDEKKSAFLNSAMPSLANIDSKYILIDFAKEILASIFLTVQIYLEQNNFNASIDEGEDNTGLSVDAMLARHISVNYHALADSGASPDECLLYLNSLSLVMAANGDFSEEQHQYISAIAAVLCKEGFLLSDFKNFVAHPNQINTENILALLKTRERQFAWLMDAIFLDTLSGYGLSEDVHKSIIAIGKALDLKQDEIETFISHAITVSTGTDQHLLFSAVKKIYKDTFSWKTIFYFRKISIESCLESLRKRLSEFRDNNLDMSFDINDLGSKIYECEEYDVEMEKMLYNIFERNLRKPIIIAQRAACISDFQKWKQKIESHESIFENYFCEVNSIMKVFGTPKFSYQSRLYKIYADKKKSVSNENWNTNMEFAYQELSNSINVMGDLIELLSEQLELYAKCYWNKSAIVEREKDKKKEQVKKKEKRRIEKEAYSTAQLSKDGESTNLHIEWTTCQTPFAVSDVRSLSSDGEQWITLVDDCLYSTSDGSCWEKITSFEDRIGYSATIKFLNSTWLLMQDDCFWFSVDGNFWKKQGLPKDENDLRLSLQDIFWGHNGWVMSLSFSKEYSYIEKFLVFDTKETSSYDAPKLYKSKSLEGEWELLIDENAFGNDGISVKDSIFFFTGELYLTICHYDRFYISNKNIMGDNNYSLMWSRNGKSWNIGQNTEISYLTNGSFIQQGSQLLYIHSDGIMTSEDGKQWEHQMNDDFRTESTLKLGDIIVCANSSGDKFLVSLDGVSWRKLNGPESGADYLSAKNNDLLCISRSNETVKLGTFIFNYSSGHMT